MVQVAQKIHLWIRSGKLQFQIIQIVCNIIFFGYTDAMRRNNFNVTTFAIFCVLIAGGYAAYQYIKFTPPTFLIKLVTSTKSVHVFPEGDVAPLIVPDGFTATIFARDIPGARVITRDNKGTILVSQTGKGKVVALPDRNGDHVADTVIEVLTGLHGPHGIAVWCPPDRMVPVVRAGSPLDSDRCLLLVAEENAVKSYTYDADSMTATFVRTMVELPSGGGHSTRSLLLEPDGGHVLIAVGSSCNVCREQDPLRASVLILDIHTSEVTTYATGLRNTVFMTTNPITGEVWGTDMGRDLLGDDIPPDEINILSSPSTGSGQNPVRDFGWPICYGKNVHDTDFDHNQYIRDPCADKTPSHMDLQAHSAPLGLAFIPNQGWPDGWENDLLVAYHGSWNRSVPTGYKVVRFDLDAKGRVLGQSDFVSGFLPAGGKGANDAIGRPVGLLAEPGGVVYISDDRAGAIYRIAWTLREEGA